MEQPILYAENISKQYGWFRKKQVVDNISFRILPSEALAFLGPNGAGKTTTIKIASGLILPDSGHVRFLGKNPHTQPKIMKYIGTVLEGNRNLFWRLTVAENLRYFAVLKKVPYKSIPRKIDEVLDQFNLEDKKKDQVRNLSRGMQQRLAIAKCWLNTPKLMILDEPTLGLDMKSRQNLIECIQDLKKKGVAIILTTHDVEIAQLICDQVIIIDKGRILKKESTSALIRQHASNTYLIELEQQIDNETRSLLTNRFKVELINNRIVFHETAHDLHELLSDIFPVTVRSVQKKDESLSTIMNRITTDSPI